MCLRGVVTVISARREFFRSFARLLCPGWSVDSVPDMKLMVRIVASLVALLVSAGCGPKASSDAGKAPATGGKLFAVSFQTMNNPFFVDLNEGLKKVIE